MSGQQQRYRNFSTDNSGGRDGRDRVPSDESYYQGMLKSTDDRKGTTSTTAFT